MINISQYILDNFAKTGKRFESHETIGRKMWGAIVKAHQLSKGFPDLKSAADDIKARAEALDFDDPSLSTTEKVIKRLANGRFAEAVKLAEDAIAHRIELDAQAVNNNAINIANKRHSQKNNILQEALDFYKRHKNRYASKEEAAEDLEEKFPPIKKSTYRKHLKGL
jgi:hypothetical protein